MGMVEQASGDGGETAGAMQGTEEQAAADVEQGCRDNAFGEERHLVVGKVAKSTGGTPGTRSQLSPRLCSTAMSKGKQHTGLAPEGARSPHQVGAASRHCLQRF